MISRILIIIYICYSLLLAFNHADTHISLNLFGDDVEECSHKHKKGSICTLEPKHLRPLQFGIAGIEVDCKKAHFEGMSDSKLKKYFKNEDRRINVIVGPSNRFYLVDGHHEARALLEADIPKKRKVLYCNIVANLARMEMDDFWDELLIQNRLWLYDEKGYAPIAPEHLPRKLSEMIDDPFRTLAWMVQRAGGFNKTGADFEDFQWSNFFRHFLNLHNETLIMKPASADHGKFYEYSNITSWNWCQVRPNSRRCLPDQLSSLKAILPLALKLSESSSASHLPGYGYGQVDPPNCGDSKQLEFLSTAKLNIND